MGSELCTDPGVLEAEEASVRKLGRFRVPISDVVRVAMPAGAELVSSFDEVGGPWVVALYDEGSAAMVRRFAWRALGSNASGLEASGFVGSVICAGERVYLFDRGEAGPV